MEVKKADSKGRLSGFKKGAYYTVNRLSIGPTIVDLLEPDADVNVPLPVSPEAREYLESLGLEINGISVNGVSRSGFDRIVSPGNHVRETWPDLFDFDKFISLLYGRQ